MSLIYYLKFDNDIQFGSPEHFWHFMWGYLLPAVNEILIIESNESSKKTSKIYIFRSCGPVMNKLINEVLSICKFNYKIIESDSLYNEYDITNIIVPRWDIWLRNFAVIEHIKFSKTYIKIYIKNLFFIFFKYSRHKSDLLKSILRLKTTLIVKFNDPVTSLKIKSYADSYLVLKRSSQPKFYKVGMKAEVPTYGTARRKLIGIEDAVQNLRNNGISINIFEPGNHTLIEQIISFQNCKGIVGIRGAEFANLIWMKPKSKVILVQPINIKKPLVQKTLAKLLELNYFEIVSDSGYPTLNADSIVKYLL